jgi:hypothetical protein
LEDLILAFVSASTRALKKEQDLAEGGWKEELNSQILVFLDLLGDNLNSIGSGATELRVRLNTYRTRLHADHRVSVNHSPAAPLEVDKTRAVPPPPESSLFVHVVRQLYDMPDQSFVELCQSLQVTCTLDAAIKDSKVSMRLGPLLTHQGASPASKHGASRPIWTV